MKRKFNYFGIAAAAVMMLASCSQDLEQSVPVTDGDVDVTFVVSPEGLNEVSTYSVSSMAEAGYKMRYVLEVYLREGDSNVSSAPESATKLKRMVKYDIPSTTTVSFDCRLPQGTYSFLTWVDYVKGEGTNADDTSDDVDASYDVENLYAVSGKYNGSVTISATDAVGTEYRDAFADVSLSKAITNLSTTFSLKPDRIVSKVNLLTNDIADLYYESNVVTKIKDVTLSYQTNATGYNVAKSAHIVEESYTEHSIVVEYEEDHDYTLFDTPANIASTYMLINGTDISHVGISTNFYSKNTPHEITENLAPALASVPVAKQTQTNILGALLTTEVITNVTVNETWSSNEKNVTIDTTTAPTVDTDVQGTTQYNPWTYNSSTAMTVATISIPSTKAEVDWSTYIKLQNSAAVGDGQIIKNIELVQATDDSYNVNVTFNTNETAYIRQVKLRIYYAGNTSSYYDQTIYQGINMGLTSGYSYPTLYYISGVQGKDCTYGTESYTADKKGNTTSNASLVDDTIEAYKITDAYGEWDASASKYYNVFDVIVRTKRNPATLKLVASSADETLTSLANGYTISTPTLVTGWNNWTEVDTDSWNPTSTSNYMKFTVKVVANTAESTTKSQVANLQFKDYPMLALGVATTSYATPSTSGTFGTLDYTNTKTGVTYSAGFQITANNIFTNIVNGDATVQNSEDGSDTAYFDVDGGTFTLDIETNKTIVEASSPTIANEDILKLTSSSVGETDEYGVTKYQYNFEVLPYTGTGVSTSTSYKIYSTTPNTTETTATLLNKTVYQNGNYHQLSQVFTASEVYGWKHGYINNGITAIYATVGGSAISIAADADGEYTYYIRTNMVDTANELKALFDTTDANAKIEQVSVSNCSNASVYYDSTLCRIYNWGGHKVFKVVVKVPVNESTTATAKYIYKFPAPNGVNLTPTVTITRSKAEAAE